MKQLDMFYDTDISRGKYNELSIIAHNKLKPIKKCQRDEVLSHVNGSLCTMEIAELMGVPLHKISGRFTELKAAGRIKAAGRKEYNGSTFTIYKKHGRS